MASITQKQRGAPPMTAPTIPSKTALSSTTARAARTWAINYKAAAMLWIAAMQHINLFSIVWALLVPEVSRGLLGFVNRDLGIPPMAIVSLFVIGIGVSLRGLKPRYGLLFMLTGQAATALAALVYTLRGTITPAQLAGHGGLFVLSACLIVAITQYERRNAIRDQIKLAVATNAAAAPALPRYIAPLMLIPVTGLILCLYSVGIALRPDAGIVTFIQDHFGQTWNDILIVWMGLGGGYILLNHIAPKWLFSAILSVGVYALMAAFLLSSDNGVSFTGIIAHAELFITMMFVAMIQIGEYAEAAQRGTKAGV